MVTDLQQACVPDTQASRGIPSRAVRVVLCAYNEEQNLAPLLRKLKEAMDNAGVPYQVILVDDGSTDRTLEIARLYCRSMPLRIESHVINQGRGKALRSGLGLAVRISDPNDVVVAMDADNTHDPFLILRMLCHIGEGKDLVIASRYRRGARIRGVPWHRSLLSFCARIVFSLTFPIQGVRDYTCGYRAYRAEVLQKAFVKFGEEGFISETGFQATADTLLKLRELDVKCSEVPLTLRYDLKGGTSKMPVAVTVLSTLGLLVRRRLGMWKIGER